MIILFLTLLPRNKSEQRMELWDKLAKKEAMRQQDFVFFDSPPACHFVHVLWLSCIVILLGLSGFVLWEAMSQVSTLIILLNAMLSCSLFSTLNLVANIIHMHKFRDSRIGQIERVDHSRAYNCEVNTKLNKYQTKKLLPTPLYSHPKFQRKNGVISHYKDRTLGGALSI